jgi:hypothetical protein
MERERSPQSGRRCIDRSLAQSVLSIRVRNLAALFGALGVYQRQRVASDVADAVSARLDHKVPRRMCRLFVTDPIGPGARRRLGPMAERVAPGHYDRLHHFVSDRLKDEGRPPVKHAA